MALPRATCEPLPDPGEGERAPRVFGFGEAHRLASGEGGTCETTDDNLKRAAREILETPAPTTTLTLAATAAGSLRDEARVADHIALAPSDRARLREHGFVVSGQTRQRTYAWAYHDVFQSELPLFVTADSIFHAIWVGHDTAIGEIERTRAIELLKVALDRLHCGLPDHAAAWPGELRREIDLHLLVARKLLAGDSAGSLRSALGDSGVEDRARRLLDQVASASRVAQVELFGLRDVDFTAFAPRGRYAADPALQRYYRSSAWLSRIELDLGPDSHDQARAAMAIAELATATRAIDPLHTLDEIGALVAGPRDDLSVVELSEILDEHRLSLARPDATHRLRALLSRRPVARARMRPTPDTKKLGHSVALLGMRAVPTVAEIEGLLHPIVPHRQVAGAADVAFLLGHEPAAALLADDMAAYPALAPALRAQRSKLAERGDDGSLLSLWLAAIQDRSAEPSGVTPSFTATAGYRDLRMSSALAAFSHVRSSYALLAGESYPAAGCTIPDAYLEPALPTYRNLRRYAERGRHLAKHVPPDSFVGAYFERLAQTLAVLERIAEHQETGHPLTDAQRRFLAMVVEMREGGSDGRPYLTGWYFDLFERRSEDGMRDADVLSSFSTSVEADTISYVGAGAPRMAAFVVDVGGRPRVMVGPVADSFEIRTAVEKRRDGSAVPSISPEIRQSPWASYLGESPAVVPFALQFEVATAADGSVDEGVFEVTSLADHEVGTVIVTALDHHRRPLGRPVRWRIGSGLATRRWKRPRGTEGARIQIGSYQRIVELETTTDQLPFRQVTLGGYQPPSSWEWFEAL